MNPVKGETCGVSISSLSQADVGANFYGTSSEENVGGEHQS